VRWDVGYVPRYDVLFTWYWTSGAGRSSAAALVGCSGAARRGSEKTVRNGLLPRYFSGSPGVKTKQAALTFCHPLSFNIIGSMPRGWVDVRKVCCGRVPLPPYHCWKSMDANNALLTFAVACWALASKRRWRTAFTAFHYGMTHTETLRCCALPGVACAAYCLIFSAACARFCASALRVPTARDYFPAGYHIASARHLCLLLPPGAVCPFCINNP